MDVAFAFALIVLAGAVVLLFAMFGELAARLPALGVGYRDPAVRPLEEARIGESPSRWPGPLAGLGDNGDPVLVLVLSSACASCETVGAQLAEELRMGRAERTGVVVSCEDRIAGEEFVGRYGLQRLPCYVDEDGEWVTGAFGIGTSPAGLLIQKQRLESALVFTDLVALRGAIFPKEEVAV